ncbi:hypothetical protein [Sphingobacterium sp. HMA12]|uniref:hypothetical protein n=1 Tax=Sphingobacterium sp. HMA12 TaxID=2050894 RepID=UPI0013151B5C|nr:hypothetical protein [Sphingobacterium sp. HMA12]
MMMRYLIIMFLLFSCINIYGQVQDFKAIPKDILGKLDSLGTDGSLLLNLNESAYFNVLFENSTRNFDFTNKKIAFIGGSNGATLSDKFNYFKDEKDRYKRSLSITHSSLKIFNAEQKKRSGGYDAVIIS